MASLVTHTYHSIDKTVVLEADDYRGVALNPETKLLDPDELSLSLVPYCTQVQRDRRLSGRDVLTTTTHSRQLCGSQLTMDAVIESDRIQALGYRIRACSLGKATTAIVAKRALGMDALELQDVQHQFEQILSGQAPNREDLLWPELAVFRPAAAMPYRHGSALLPFQALQKLFEKKKVFDEALRMQANHYVPTGDSRWCRM